MSLRIVHVSDIHFHGAAHGWDGNRDQRRELVADLEQIVLRDGPINAVLVGGDIAFSAEHEEYVVAATWLSDLVAVCGGIDNSAVYTVPGNHDVSWAVLGHCAVAKDFRAHLRDCPPTAVDELLRERMSADPGAGGLFIPFGSYNAFASKFLCETSPERPSWADDSTLEVDGWPVRLSGLNSALTSDWADHEIQGTHAHTAGHADGETGQAAGGVGEPSRNSPLVLGTEQCTFPRDGSIIIAMAHHPPAWLRDWAIVEHHMRRAHLWLFGHEHIFEAHQDVPLGSVHIAAGAVGPDRSKDGEQEPYVPAYSVITLSRTEHDTLRVHVLPRYWSLEATRFVDHPDGDKVFEVARDPALPDPDSGGDASDELAVAGSDRGDQVTATADVQETSGPGAEHKATPSSASPLAHDHHAQSGHSLVQVEVVRPDLRRIATRFMSKPATRRIAIGLELGVIEDADLEESNRSDLYRLILRRIRDQGLIDELAVKAEDS